MSGPKRSVYHTVDCLQSLGGLTFKSSVKLKPLSGMTKIKILKVLKAHLGIFEDVRFKHDGNHVIVYHDDQTCFWSAAEIECIVDVCRGLKLSFYIDGDGVQVYSNSSSAL